MERFTCLDLARHEKSAQGATQIGVCQALAQRFSWYKTGNQQLLGMPFQIASDPADGSAGIRLAPGEDSRFSVQVGARAKWLIVIHDADVGCGDYTEPVLRYVLHRDGAPDIEKDIRYGIEMPALDGTGGGRTLFNAALPGLVSPQAPFFFRETGLQNALAPSPPSYQLYVWENPEPDVPIASIECDNIGRAAAVVSAITLCNEPEHPVRTIPRTTLAIDFKDIENLDLKDVQVAVDRGMVVRVEPLEAVADDFMESDKRGWGVAMSPEPKALRAEIYAPDGADVSVKTGKGVNASVGFGESLKPGGVDLAGGKIRVEMLHPGKTWVHAKVMDADTGQTVPARVHFSGSRGEYIPPAGHHRDVNTGTMEMYGTDVRIGETNYAYVDGNFQIDLPVGKVYAEVGRGLEYIPLRKELEIEPGQRELTLPVKRLTKMTDKGYYSADTHVHFVTTQGGLLEAGAEDLNILNILATQLGKLFTSFSQFSGAPSTVSTDDHIVYVNQENRQHVLGHINLLGLKRPVFPVCSGGPPEAWLGDALEASIADWADETHDQGGLVIQPHFGQIFNEYIPDALSGRIDATEIAPWAMLGAEFFLMAYSNWYRTLNCGIRMPVVGGTDKMSDAQVVGGCRTYAHIPGGDKLTYDGWCDAIRAGNTFTTTGPMLFLTADGLPVGSTIPMKGSGGHVEVEATATGYFPLRSVELIQNGQIIAVVTPQGPDVAASTIKDVSGGAIATEGIEWDDCTLTLKARVPITHSGWVAVRCWGRDGIPGPRGLVAAHTSPVYFDVGGQNVFVPNDAKYMLQIMDEMLAWAEDVAVYRTPEKKIDVVGLFAQAKQTLHDKLHEHDTDHSH